MSKFVNFQKRSVTLPDGCKDLIDLLEPPRRRTKVFFEADEVFGMPGLESEHVPTDGLAEVGRYVSRLLESQDSCLTICQRSERHGVACCRMLNTLEMTLWVEGPRHEQEIRAFFGSRHIPASQDL